MSESSASLAPEEPDKTCVRCKIQKPATAFHRMGSNKRMSKCAACRSETRPSRPGHLRKAKYDYAQKRRSRLKVEYGITVEQYALMLEDQGGGCAVCGQPPTGKRPLAVDHCHQTGRVRALLCAACNIKLGAYETFRRQAEEFLKKYGRGNPLLNYER